MIGEAKGALVIQAGLLPTAFVLDWRWGLAMLLGMIGGWLGRIAISVEAKRPWEAIKHDLLVMGLASFATALVTVGIARLSSADELGVAFIGFAVAASGTKAVTLLRDWIVNPILNAIRNTGGTT